DFSRYEECKMVQINVSQQLKSPIGTRRNYQVSEMVDIDGNNRLVHGEVELTRTERSLLVQGVLYAEAELTCSRCLNVFSCPLTLDVEEEYFPTTDVVGGTALPLPDDPDSFTIDKQNILDLTEAIRQYMLLAIPMKPLCYEDCAGLCPACGHNLNQSPCNCPPQPADSRWSKLLNRAEVDTEASVND
ncbi:MAG: DUF177 domain-containing protein, partial [Dehalococcoidales bacterium]|nr:DUF177 domain-containing protein [Dehalococcoidales bacterium]